MATIATQADGNWSAAGTWSGGVPPTAGDVADMNHNVTLDIDATVDQLDVANGKVLTMNAGYGVTGMTTSMPSTGQVYMNAGCALKWDSASSRGPGESTEIITRGTSGSRCVIDNVGAGALYVGSFWRGYYDMKWTEVLSFSGKIIGDDVSLFEDCLIKAFNTSTDIVCSNVTFRRSALCNCRRVSTEGQSPRFEGCVFGEDLDGGSYPNAWTDFQPAGGFYRFNGVRFTHATPIGSGGWGRVWIDNYGCALGSGNPGTTRVHEPYWYWERSTSAAKAGTYGIRLTPQNANIAYPGRFGEVEVYVPIESGQDVTVSGYLRHHGLSSDCAEVIIDPEGTWFDTPVGEVPNLASADTWYEVTPTTGTTGARGTGQAGMCRIVVYLYEYAASSYLDVADFVITVA